MVPPLVFLPYPTRRIVLFVLPLFSSDRRRRFQLNNSLHLLFITTLKRFNIAVVAVHFSRSSRDRWAPLTVVSSHRRISRRWAVRAATPEPYPQRQFTTSLFPPPSLSKLRSDNVITYARDSISVSRSKDRFFFLFFLSRSFRSRYNIIVTTSSQ